MNGKEIIFRVNELSNKDNQGWIPYAKPIKLFILDYISKSNARPNAKATLVNEMFSILCDLESFYQKTGQLDNDGYFYQLPKTFKEEWGILPDTVNSTTEILVEMGWIEKEVRGAYDYSKMKPLFVPYYKIKHDAIIKDLVKKYPSLQKLF